jgi:hypothetical protein
MQPVIERIQGDPSDVTGETSGRCAAQHRTEEGDMEKNPAITPSTRTVLMAAWADERAAARAARQRREAAGEWNHLERAHILSQPMAGPHVRTHLAMLGYGIRHHDRREVVGQIVRVLVAGPGSWTGRYPLGNTGGAGVSALQPMPVPQDLQAVLGTGSASPGVIVN